MLKYFSNLFSFSKNSNAKSINTPLDIYGGQPTMLISQDNNATNLQIKSYKPGEIVTHEQTFHRSIIISPEKIISDWPPQNIIELQKQHLKIICEQAPEIFILGTGEQQIFPDPSLLADVYQCNIGVEIMATHAACRTYNVLISEDRRVIAALLIQ